MKTRYMGIQEIIRYPDDTEETIVVSSNHLAEAVEVINTNNFKKVSIESSYRKADVDFLEYCSNIEGLHISNSSITNFEGMKYLKNLRMLSLNVKQTSKIDIGQLVLL